MPASTRTDTAEGTQLIADNRKARHDYHVFGTYEAGMASAALARGLSQLAVDWPRRHHVEPWMVETQGLNLPPERYSLEVRRQVAEAAASRSFDEALFDLSRSTGAAVPTRQAEQLVARAAEDFDASYEVRRATAGEPPPEGSHAPERRSDCRQDGGSGADDRLRRNRVGASPLRAPPIPCAVEPQACGGWHPDAPPAGRACTVRANASSALAPEPHRWGRNWLSHRELCPSRFGTENVRLDAPPPPVVASAAWTWVGEWLRGTGKPWV